MGTTRKLTAIIEREGDGYVALCPELDIANQGETIEQARANLVEALTLFFETAHPSEVERRLHSEVFVTQVEVPVGFGRPPQQLRWESRGRTSPAARRGQQRAPADTDR